MICQTRSYRKNRLPLWAVLTSCGLALAACKPAPRAPEFFPLNDGLEWHYRLSTENRLGRRTVELDFKSQTVTSAGAPAAATRLSSNGTRYFFENSPRGIYRVAKQTIADAVPVSDATARAILKQPIDVGTSWSNTTHPYVLSRLIPMGENIRRSVSLTMRYAITSTRETVTVPAGTYTDCVKVVGTATFELYADGPSGYVSVPITTEEWYAPEVGLVKLIRTEDVQTEVFTGGTAVLELIDFRG